jgi:O-antigen/teichoic acid export membrane protein
MQASSRVFVNTGALYIKLIITTIINLYLTRIVLSVLGIDDFGIYSLIAGVVNMLAFLSGSLMSAMQRYMSVAMGQGDFAYLRRIFSISVKLHYLFAIIIFVVLEILSSVLFGGALNISPDRMEAAKIVYQIMILSVVCTIIITPYNAALNAHEHLWLFAIVETFTTIIKLGLIFVLSHANDALIFYTAWMLLATIINSILKIVWCRTKYAEIYDRTKVRIKDNLPLIRELGSYIGWNSLSSFAVVGRDQGTAVILNLFFTTAINGVVGIANQVRGLLAYFSSMLTASITPQIMKSKGEGNNEKLLYLSVFACKLSFLLSATLALPVLLNLEFILNLWLTEVPEYTFIYCRLVIFSFIISQLFPGLYRLILADGNIKNYLITQSFLLLLPLAVAPVLFHFGFEHYTIFFLAIVAEVCLMIASALFAYKLLDLNIVSYFIFVLKSACLFAFFYGIGKFVCQIITNQLLLITINGILLTIMFVLLYCFIIFNKKESVALKQLVNNLIHGIL